MWALYAIKANSKRRKKIDEYTSIIEAFKAGNELIQSAANQYKRYRVEKVSDANEQNL